MKRMKVWGGICVVAAGAAWLAWQVAAPSRAPVTMPPAVASSPLAMPRSPTPVTARKPDPVALSLAARLRAAEADGTPIAELIQAWLPHAGEDPELSMSLAFELLECTALAPNEEAFVEHDAAAMSAPERDRAARDLNRRAGICEGIDDREQMQYDLVTAAAASGNLTAQTSYIFLAGPYVRSERSMVRDGIRETYKRDAVRFAKAALASRTRTAYDNAHTIFSSDLFGARDPVAAYAYLLMATRGSTPALADRLQPQAAATLTAQQVQQAQAMASRLVVVP